MDSEYTVKGYRDPIKRWVLPLRKGKEGGLADAKGVYVTSLYLPEVIDASKRMKAAGLKYFPEGCEIAKPRKYGSHVACERELNVKKILNWKAHKKPDPIEDFEKGDETEGT